MCSSLDLARVGDGNEVNNLLELHRLVIQYMQWQFWCSSQKSNVCWLAQVIDVHSNKESKKKNRRVRKGSGILSSIVILSIILCVSYIEDTEVNRAGKIPYSYAACSGGKDEAFFFNFWQNIGCNVLNKVGIIWIQISQDNICLTISFLLATTVLRMHEIAKDFCFVFPATVTQLLLWLW